MGTFCKLGFPTIDDVTNQVKNLGAGCFLFKIDLKCAYRQLRVDPSEYNLTGLEWKNQLYINSALMFVARPGALCMTRVNQFKRFVLAKHNHNVLIYIDDAIGAGTPA